MEILSDGGSSVGSDRQRSTSSESSAYDANASSSSMVLDLDSGEESCVSIQSSGQIQANKEEKKKLLLEATKRNISYFKGIHHGGSKKFKPSLVSDRRQLFHHPEPKPKIIRDDVPKVSFKASKKATANSAKQKWRQRKKRYRFGPTSSKLCTANVMSSQIRYRQCGSIVLFQVGPLLSLAETVVPLNTHLQENGTLVKLPQSSGIRIRKDTTAAAAAAAAATSSTDNEWRRDFISWKAFRNLLNKAIVDQAIRDLFNNYVPFESRGKGPDLVKQANNSLEQDCLKIAGVSIPFMVQNGKIYMDLLATFTLLGQLKLALKNDWDKVDDILEAQGILQKDAFRRTNKARHRDRRWGSQRSHINFAAVRVLAEKGLIEEEDRKQKLCELFAHLQYEMQNIRDAKQQLYDNLLLLVNSILAPGPKQSEACRTVARVTSPEDSKADVLKPDELIGTEICGSGCGRLYHFTIRCCALSHHLTLADKSVGYIVYQGEMFLEKCSAFAALGRMYVIRCSDFRRSDRILKSAGLDPLKHYLFENMVHTIDKPNDDDPVNGKEGRMPKSNRRYRRTHISLAAFITLVHMGFGETVKKEELLSSVRSIVDNADNYKAKCANQNKGLSTTSQDDSSGIDTGSSDNSSGQNSPSMDQMKPEEEPPKANETNEPVNQATICNKPINCMFEHDRLYLCMDDLEQFFDVAEYECFNRLLKRRARSLDLTLPFYPTFFKPRDTKQFVSLECFKEIVERDYLNPSVEKEQLQEDLENMMHKFGGVVSSIGVDEDDDDDDDDDEEEAVDEVEEDDIEECEEENKGDVYSRYPSSTVDETSNTIIPHVNVLGSNVPFRVVNGNVFLSKKHVFRLFSVKTNYRHRFKLIDQQLIDNKICQDDAFLFDARRRNYVSTRALRVLVDNGHLKLDEEEKKCNFMKRLDELERDKDILKQPRALDLQSFNSITYRISKSIVFLNTSHFLKAVGCSTAYLAINPSRAYAIIVKLLKNRGMDVTKCFLKQGKAKYSHVSVYACFLLFKTEFGPFKDKKRMKLLQKEISNALKALNLPSVQCQHMLKQELAEQDAEEANSDNKMKIGGEFQPLAYKIHNGMFYLHRKSAFTAIGIEQAILSSSKGYVLVNNILVANHMDLADCYLKNDDQYAYISLPALLALLDSEDPLVSCLERRVEFSEILLRSIQSKMAASLWYNGRSVLCFGDKYPFISWKYSRNRIYLQRPKSYASSGLYEKSKSSNRISGDGKSHHHPASVVLERGLDVALAFHKEGTDAFAYVSVETLLALTRLDGEIKRCSTYHQLVWTDMISAVMHETPKLRIQAKMIEFRQALLKAILQELIFYMENTKAIEDGRKSQDGPSSSSPSSSSSITHEVILNEEKDLDPDSEEAALINEEQLQQHGGQEVAVVQIKRNDHDEEERMDEEEGVIVSKEEYMTLLASVQESNAKGMIGDWVLERCDQQEIRLVVNPGYGASRKMSFMQPDVWAILHYEFVLKPDARHVLSINSRQLPHAKTEPVFRKAVDKGIYNLLYTLLTIRPCFGCFQPELVETFEKRGADVDEDHIIDANFIGSSQNGRTYAGTVRSRRCGVLAESRVSDTCSACSGLHNRLVINRSVLLSPKALKTETAAFEQDDEEKQSTSSSVPAGSRVRRSLKDLPTTPSSASRSASQDSTGSSGGQLQQQSVWKVEETSVSGCTFLCPQLQSFNTSLPHQFVITRQATAVVEHRVYIGSDLNIKVTFNKRPIVGKSFPDFEKNKQVGPLLDHVASLRLCVGYPDPQLVSQARYLMDKKHLLVPEIRKFFNYIVVDEEFHGKRNVGEETVLQGTLRTPGCRYVAGDFADICEECRLLQEPLEFLGV